jgi:hypothetical protein
VRHRHNTPTPRRRLVGAWIVLVALALYLPHSAGADATPAPSEGWGAAELRIAALYWGTPMPPLCETTAVEFDAPLPPGTLGEATVPVAPGAACWMKIAPQPARVYMQCVTVVHEYGHWMGLGHSGDVSSPMAAEFNPTIYVRGCAKLSRRSVTGITHKPRRMR